MHPFWTGREELLQICWALKKTQQTPHQRGSHLMLSLAKPCWHPKHRNSLKMARNNPVQQRALERDDSETWGEIVTECSGISREILVLWHCAEAGEYLIILSVQFYTLKYKLDLNGAWYFMLVFFCTYPKQNHKLSYKPLLQAGPLLKQSGSKPYIIANNLYLHPASFCFWKANWIIENDALRSQEGN